MLSWHLFCCTFVPLHISFLFVFHFQSWPRSYFVQWLFCTLYLERLNISRVVKADCVHMFAVVRGCMCDYCRLLLQCINGAFGFSCHLCVYPFCCQSVCFCACAHLNHCSLYKLKTRLGGAVIFSQLHRLLSLRNTAQALSQMQKGLVWRRVSTTGSFSLIAWVVHNLQWDANQAFHMQN